MDTDRNLLFAVLALQADLIDRERFVRACTLWAARQDGPIAGLLVALGWLTAADRAAVEHLVEFRLHKFGGDARAGLAAAATPGARSALATVLDAAGRQSPAAKASPATPPGPDPLAFLRELSDEWKLTTPGGRAGTDSFPAEPSSGTAGRNLLYEEIGRGGMGRVLRGRDPDLGRELAVKVLREDYGGDPGLERRFVEEAQVGGQLQHPGVVPVYELGRFPDRRPFFTMKLVKGRTLAALLAERPDAAHDRARFVAIFGQVCQAVAYAHSKGVIHRDLKPGNVMVGAFGEVQVMDWGLAKVLPPRGTAGPEALAGSLIRTVRSGSTAEGGQTGVVGTPAYMPPEQARGEVDGADERADVFGLGGILCDVLTGQPPHAGLGLEDNLRRAAAGDLSDALGRLAGCGADPALVALCRDCLAPRPEDRPGDAGEVAARVAEHQAAVQERLRQAELERAAAQARAEEAKATAVAERKARRRAVGMAAALVLLVAGGGGGAWWAQQVHQARVAEAARRQQAADAAVTRALDAARPLRDQARQDPLGSAARFDLALAAATQADELARSGDASEELRREAADLVTRLVQETGAARRDGQLLARLPDVRRPREGPRHRRDETGPGTELAEPNEDEQFAAAFREWGLDVDAVPTAEAAARLKGRPPAVVAEVVAALDDWTAQRQEQGMPPAELRRVADLAAALDEPDSKRRELRALLARGNLGRERGLGALALALRPVPVPFDAAPGEDRARLRRLVEATDPAEEPVLGLLASARALLAAGDGAGAERLLRAAVQARPQEVVLHSALGQVLEQQRPPRWRDAVECHVAARALRPELGAALARALEHGGRIDEGLALYRRLARAKPDSLWTQGGLGNALYRLGRFPEAEAVFRDILRRWPDLPEAHNNLGAALKAQGKPKDAAEAFHAALSLRPHYATAHFNLGATLAELDRPQEAAASFREAIRLRPDQAAAHYSLGGVLDTQRHFREAEAACCEAIRLDPDDPTGHNNLGAALLHLGRVTDAAGAFRAALRLNPDYADAHYNLGNALGQQRRFGEAEAAYGEVLRRRPGFAEAHNNRGNVLKARARLPEAEADYREAIRLRHDYPEAHYNLGNVLYLRGLFPESEAAFREATRLRPDYAMAHCNLGHALREQGRFADALEELRRGDALGRRVPGWTYPSADWVRDCERLLDLDRRLPSVLRGGTEPATAAEHVEFASLCRRKRLNAAATRFYAGAFAADPKLADDIDRQRRYDAACCAARAAAGVGEDAKLLPDKVVLALRLQALGWLRADLALYAKLAGRDEAAARQAVRQHLARWLRDADLACVRDREALDQLPEGERQDWRRLWRDEVPAVFKKLEEKK